MGKFDHKMAYDRAEISRLKNDIHLDDIAKKDAIRMEGQVHEGVVNYGKAHGDAVIQNASQGYAEDKVPSAIQYASKSPITRHMKGFVKDGVIMNLTSEAHKDKLISGASNPGFAAAISKEAVTMKTNQEGGYTGKDYGAASKQIAKLGE